MLQTALNFNKTGYLKVEKYEVPFGSTYTIEVWVKFNSLTQANYTSIIGRGDSGNSNALHFFNNSLYLRSGETNNGGTLICPISTFKINTWTHIAISVENRNATLYINGEINKTFTIYRNLTSTSPILIGNWSSSYTAIFNGSLSELRIWNVSRTHSQIRSNFNKKIKDITAEISYYFPLDSLNDEQSVIVGSILTDTINLYSEDKVFLKSNYYYCYKNNKLYFSSDVNKLEGSELPLNMNSTISDVYNIDENNNEVLISPISLSDFFKNKNNGNVNFLYHNEDYPKSEISIKINTLPYKQLMIPIGDISLIGVETIDGFSLISKGNVKVAISFDNGLTWKSYKNGTWVIVENAHSGMSNLELNALTREQIELGRENSNYIIFSYSLSNDAEVDNIEMMVTMQGYEKIADTKDFDIKYDEPNNKLVYTIKKNGTYSVNYVT